MSADKPATILIATFDGGRVQFFDASGVTQATLSRLIPHLTDVERVVLSRSRELGYGVMQQFAHAVAHESTYRASQLIDLCHRPNPKV